MLGKFMAKKGKLILDGNECEVFITGGSISPYSKFINLDVKVEKNSHNVEMLFSEEGVKVEVGDDYIKFIDVQG